MKFVMIVIILVFGFKVNLKATKNVQFLKKLVTSDRESLDNFGSIRNSSDSIVVIGAVSEDHDENGQNALSDAGSVYIFKKNSSGIWTQTQKIVASDRQAGDLFGYSSVIYNNTMVISARLEDHDENGQNEITDAGSAYIFEKNNNGVWIQTQKIVASDRQAQDYFGTSVSIYGDMIAISASAEDHDENGQNALSNAGAVYIFEKNNNGVWIQTQKIVASDRQATDRFGVFIDLESSNLFVGAPYQDYDSNGNNYLLNAGAGYIFEKGNNGVWTQTQKIVAPTRYAYDEFSYRGVFNQNTLLLGAPYNSYDENENNYLQNAGAAYIFKKNNGSWVFSQKLVAPDRTSSNEFGRILTINSENIIVTGYRNSTDENGQNYLYLAGAVYFYQKNNQNEFDFYKKLVNSDRVSGDYFGTGLALVNDYIFLSAPNQDYDENGNNFVSNAGAVYVYGIFSKPNIKSNTITNRFVTSVQISNNIDINLNSTTFSYFIGTSSGNYSSTTSEIVFNKDTIYNISIQNLNSGSKYYALAFAENSSSFTYGSELSFWTLTSEPNSQSNSFNQIGQAKNSITFSFQALNEINADGYLLIKSNSTPTNPTDGKSYNVNDTYSNTTVVGKITDQNTTYFVLDGLPIQSTSSYKLVPYNVGDDPTTINYNLTNIPFLNAYTVPFLDEWGMITFVGLMAIGGFVYMRKRIA